MEPTAIKHLIMSESNPNGYTIEELIEQLAAEVRKKDEVKPSSRNCATIGYLHLALSAQRKRMEEAA